MSGMSLKPNKVPVVPLFHCSVLVGLRKLLSGVSFNKKNGFNHKLTKLNKFKSIS